ncbi:MAG: hypothetical protein QOF53_2282 [Nocardioidaceae bacterium]|jgi:nucleotide-binding universal stress UspA family protein|nr:hypothetical protein [Nocardioidaceae bacterium]
MRTLVAPGSVLVGVDGSTGSDDAVRWAATYAAAQRRPLAIVHGAGAPESLVADFLVDLQQARLGLLRKGRTVTDRARALAWSITPSLNVRTRVEACDPRLLLAEEASEAHLMVLGRRGHGAVTSLLPGSVSLALAAHALCPVVVVRPAGDDDTSLRVVVGVDGVEDSTSALTFAFELAADQRRPLQVVHAAGPARLSPALDTADGMAADMAGEVAADAGSVLVEWVAGFAEKFPDVSVTCEVVQGSAPGALVAASEHASTVVVGARGCSALTKRLLGSVSRSVVEHACCTVAVIRGAQT